MTANHEVSSAGEHPGRLFRSAGAVLAGFIAIVILSIGTDMALHAAGVLPDLGKPVSDRLLVVAMIYRSIYSVAGCYLTARLAPSKPMIHALALGMVGLFVSIAGTIVTWNSGPAFAQKWYAFALVALSIPCAWAGGWLRLIQLRSRAR